MKDENGQKRTSAKKTAIVPALDRVHDLLTDPREILLLRLLHGGLNENEIAFELRGSHGFAESVEARVRRVLDFEGKEALRAFATQWCEDNPLPVQQSLEVAKPSPELGMFAVVHGELREHSCLHRIYLPPSTSHDDKQRELLLQYVDRIIEQNRAFNFTGGSTINGLPAPGWHTLKELWPRRLILGKRVDESDSDFLVELSYGRRTPQSSTMIRAMYVWLDAQFTEYADCVLVHKPGGGGLIHLEDVSKWQ